MKKTSTIMLFTCILWYAAASTMNTFAITIAFIVTLTVLPFWAFITALKTGRQPIKWLLLSIILPLIAPLALAITARKDITEISIQEKQAGKQSYFEKRFGIWGGLIPYVAVLLLVVIIYAGSGSGFPSLTSSKMPYTGSVRYVDTTNGNSTSNLVNGGMMTSILYYNLFTNEEDEGKIYAISIREKNAMIEFNEDSGYNFCNYSDYVYYINKSDNDHIYRLNQEDGSDSEKILNDSTSQFCMCEKMIYYINKDDKNRIYRVDLKGKNKVRLGKKSATNLFQLYGTLYYLNMDDDNRIYKISSEGKGNKKVSKDRVGQMFYEGGRIYYINLDDKKKIYSITDEGKDKKIECEDSVSCIASDSFNIYYSNEDDKNRIYKIDMQNGNTTKLTNDTDCTNINIQFTDISYITNGKQKFVDGYNGNPLPAYYPELTPVSKEPLPDIQIPEPPKPPSRFSPDTSIQHGEYIFPDGALYNGELKNGLPNGTGTVEFPNNDRYMGEWNEGKKEGEGTFITEADHSIFTGEWSNDKKNGQGSLIKDGKTIEGVWKDDEYISNSQ